MNTMAPRGGKREGAGRPSVKGPSKQIRIPQSLVPTVKHLIQSGITKLPLYSSRVQAGFPSPADDYIERHLDLNEEFIKHPSSTFILKASGESMIDAGIFPGDMLLVDKSLEPTDGKIVIAALDGELTVKRLSKQKGRVQLLPANSKFKPIDITEEVDLVIWGVVTLVFHEPI